MSSSTVTGTPVSGNPVSYFNGVRWEFEWEQGRNLNQAYNFSTNSIRLSTTKVDTETTLDYTYDLDGIRTGKTSVVQQYGYGPSSGGGVVASIGENTVEPNATSYVRYLIGTATVQHSYVTQNGKIVRETIGSGANAQVLDFIYDESGKPFALKYTNGTEETKTYYYVLNLQGDVVELVEYEHNGLMYTMTTVASYTYNAWGEILTATGEMASINPLRYRGYYYDAETGFYYLQSRYYDPTMHRFINADSLASAGQGILGHNMFAYCNNSPSMLKDFSGYIPSACMSIYDPNTGFDAYYKALDDAEDIARRATINNEGISIDMDAEYDNVNRILEHISLQYLCDIIATEACNIYAREYGKEFLLSDYCVSYEIEEHIEAYFWAVGDKTFPNKLAAGFVILSIFEDRYDEKSVYNATKSIDIRLGDVVRGDCTSQASVFGYKDGIRDIYVGTSLDPWRAER